MLMISIVGFAVWFGFMRISTTGYEVNDHFRGVTKMITLGKGGQLKKKKRGSALLSALAGSAKKFFHHYRNHSDG